MSGRNRRLRTASFFSHCLLSQRRKSRCHRHSGARAVFWDRTGRAVNASRKVLTGESCGKYRDRDLSFRCVKDHRSGFSRVRANWIQETFLPETENNRKKGGTRPPTNVGPTKTLGRGDKVDLGQLIQNVDRSRRELVTFRRWADQVRISNKYVVETVIAKSR